MSLPHVVVLSLGGTIASAGQAGRGVAPSLTAQDLLAGVPDLAGVAAMQAATFRQVPSADLTLADAVALAREIRRRVEDGAQGVVVTQGTDTLEEMAFALDCLLDLEVPVVITGAMRNPTLPGADGPANLLAAVQTAASASARGLGVCVVFNDEIHAARFVQKTHTTSTATFRSPQAGPVGAIVEGRVRVHTRLVRRPAIELRALERVPEVALIRMVMGDRGRLLEVLGARDYDGLVLEGFGGGHVPACVVEPAARLAQAMPVILASRTGCGEVLQATYGFPGSESDLLSHGLIGAGYLDGLKARVLLTLQLAAGAGRAAIAASFATQV